MVPFVGRSGAGDHQDLVRRVDDVGGFFRLERVAAEDARCWRPLPQLTGTTEELRFRAERARVRFSMAAGGPPQPAVDARAAASVLHLGLAARLVSPALAMIVLADVVPAFGSGDWLWREPVDGEPSIGMGLRAAPRAPAGGGERVADAGGDRLEEAFRTGVLEGALWPLEDAVHRGCGVSRRVLRGNLVSALVGTATVLASVERGFGPAGGPAASDVRDRLLRLPEFAGEGGFGPDGAFHRSSCCLYYRLPGGRLCGDCVLATRRTARP